MLMQKRLIDTGAFPSSPNAALRTAWWAYLGLLLLPFAMLAVVISLYSNAGTRPMPSHHVNQWFLATMAYLAIGLPAALFYRRHVCDAYFRGKVVAPRRYLVGMLMVWLSLEVGMIATIVGCYMTSSFLPGLFPGVVAFGFFITLWPTGKMMISRVGKSDDPQIYEEPR